MALIYETQHFTLESHEKPEIDRLEGGHAKINPKRPVRDRTELSPAEAVELAWLTSLADEAMVRGMARRGVEIGRINYQDNGNWKPELHVHLYGRAVAATRQRFGDPITPGGEPDFVPLDAGDVMAIREEIEALAGTPRFAREAWRLA